MTYAEVTNMAIQLMTEHNLTQEGWVFLIDPRPTKRAGQCRTYRERFTGRITRKEIAVSKKFIDVNKKEAILDVVLHEMAHAIVGLHHKHDYVWKRKFEELGGSGHRYANYIDDVVLPQTKYVADCPSCGKQYRAHRVITRAGSCSVCSGGRYNSDYHLVFKPNPLYKR